MHATIYLYSYVCTYESLYDGFDPCMFSVYHIQRAYHIGACKKPCTRNVTLCAYVHERIRTCGISGHVVRRCGQRLKTSRSISMCVYSIQAPYSYPQRLSLCIRSASKKKNLNSCNWSCKVPQAV